MSPDETLQRLRQKIHDRMSCWSDMVADMVADRDAWRHSIFKTVNEFDEDRSDAQKDKTRKWEARAAVSNTPPHRKVLVRREHDADDMDRHHHLRSSIM